MLTSQDMANLSEEEAWNLHALMLAGIHGRTAEFEYEHDGVRSWREVTPTNTEYHSSTDTYNITADDHTVDDVRQFRLDRIIDTVTVY